MGKVRALDQVDAKRTLAHKLTPLADKLRQKFTEFGLRSQRVFLIWTRWTGEERGEGEEIIAVRRELLPTPRVTSANAIAWRPYAAGQFPEGTIRVDQISSAAYDMDHLTGLRIPEEYAQLPCNLPDPPEGPSIRTVDGIELDTDRTVDFFWELHEDGRGERNPERMRYRVYGTPDRDPSKYCWGVTLQRADESRSRKGFSQVGVDPAVSDGRNLFGG